MPLSWNKTAGRDTFTGLVLRRYTVRGQFGISQRHADWLMKWTTEVAASRTVRMRSFEEYVAGALEYERPQLVSAYVSSAPRTTAAELETSRLRSQAVSQSVVSPRRCPNKSLAKSVPSRPSGSRWKWNKNGLGFPFETRAHHFYVGGLGCIGCFVVLWQ